MEPGVQVIGSFVLRVLYLHIADHGFSVRLIYEVVVRQSVNSKSLPVVPGIFTLLLSVEILPIHGDLRISSWRFQFWHYFEKVLSLDLQPLASLPRSTTYLPDFSSYPTILPIVPLSARPLLLSRSRSSTTVPSVQRGAGPHHFCREHEALGADLSSACAIPSHGPKAL